MYKKVGQLIVSQQANKKNTGTVLFLHGSGDTGAGVLEWVQFLIGKLTSPHIKFVFPTAPLQPYTPNKGKPSNVWFDRLGITPYVPEHSETIEFAAQQIKGLIETEVANGVPLNRIVIGGFSMGGALSMHIAYRYLSGLGGCFALSSFLNEKSAVYKHLKDFPSSSPLYMCHGERDIMVPIDWGETTFHQLSELGVKGEFVPLKNTLHELKKDELENLLQWINKIIPESN